MFRRALCYTSVVLLGISTLVSSCSSLHKQELVGTLNGNKIYTSDLIEGRVSQYLDRVYLERPTDNEVTYSSTQYSG